MRKALFGDCCNRLSVRFVFLLCKNAGAIAQLGERLLCKQEVVGSIPSGSTNFLFLN